MPTKDRNAHNFPDLSAKFCQNIFCSADLRITDLHLAGLKRLSVKKASKSIMVGAEYKGRNAWNHISVRVTRETATSDKWDFRLFMHTHPGDEQREARPRRLFDVLDAVGGTTGEVELTGRATFAFPSSRFVPAVAFPTTAGLGIPLAAPGIPVNIVGLRFGFESGPISSVTLDVSTGKRIFVSSSWTFARPISSGLPEYCLDQASALAERLVSEKREGAAGGR